ncbi:MAG: tetratricopeptide repeat protein [Candidatus Sumerlaeia bacterium]|nr:tetratricopeptide repeat protein [Candidatus Sumerlaeia bacterium]
MAERAGHTEQLALLIEKGKLALEKGDYGSAVVYFRQALHICPLLNEVRELLAYALDKQLLAGAKNNQGCSQIDVKRIIGKSNLSPKPAEVSATYRKSWLWVVFSLVLVLVLLLGMVVVYVLYKESIDKWLIAVLPEKIQPIPPEEREALGLYNTADIYFKQNRYDDAIETLQKALALNPPSRKKIEDKLAIIYNAKGEALYDREKYLEAIAAYEKAISYNSQVADYFYNLGWAYYRYGLQLQLKKKPAQKYLDLAEKSFKKALEIDSGMLRAYQGLARVYTRLNRPELSAKMYQKIIELAPESYEAEIAKQQLKNMFGEKVK